jgi:hypothetical protein
MIMLALYLRWVLTIYQQCLLKKTREKHMCYLYSYIILTTVIAVK